MTTQTALITGASSGIGLEIAKELARKRFDLILVARREDKLQELAALLSPHVKVTVLPFDLSLSEAPQQLFEALQDRQIDVLVNNAGFADYGPFAQSDGQKMTDMLEVNVMALTKLTRLFLPPMIERKAGRILNVASVAAFFPGPLMSVYYASKAYVLSFSEALVNEVQGTGVTVTCLCPGATTSGFQEVAGLSESKLMRSITVSSKQVAQRGVRAMLRGDGVYLPGLNNQMVTMLPRFLPRGALAPFIRRLQEKF
jgi:short-subunit dehydrogenase